MKFFFIYSLFLSIILLSNKIQANNNQARLPVEALSCFEQADLLPSYMLSGQGLHQDKNKAKADALQDISHQLSVQVDSEVKTQTNLNDNKFNEGYSSSANLTSNTKLTEVNEVCSGYSRQSNEFFILYAIDNRPPILRLAQKLLQSWENKKPSHIVWTGNKHLIKSSAISQLNKLLINSKPTVELTKHVAVDLTYYNNSWRLTLDLVNQTISSEKIVDFFKLPKINDYFNFTVKRSQGSKWLTTTQLTEGDEFKFVLSAPKNSFFQLVNIYQDGRVAALSGIRRLTEDKISLPSEGIFEAGLLVQNRRTVDIYLAIVSDKPFDAITLEQLEAWQGMVKGQEAYQLASLLYWLEEHSDDVNISAIKVITKPR